MLLILIVLAAGAFGQKLDEVCGACHTEPAADFRSHAHFAKRLSCDACHGPSKAHRDATGHKPVDRVAAPSEQPQVCGTCHTGPRKAYESGSHGKLVAVRDSRRAAACTTCHGTHAPRAAAAMVRQCSRCHASLPAACSESPKVAARLRCAGCHEPHALVRR
jgi:hypothetical protein